jgi:hypothetical protein
MPCPTLPVRTSVNIQLTYIKHAVDDVNAFATLGCYSRASSSVLVKHKVDNVRDTLYRFPSFYNTIGELHIYVRGPPMSRCRSLN